MDRVRKESSGVPGWDDRIQRIRDAIAGRGHVLLPAMGREEWTALIRRLGEILDTTRVELNPFVSTYLCQPGEVPLHSDHPDAELISWRCERPDPRGTPQLLCDSRAVVDALDVETRQVLMRTRVSARYRGDGVAKSCPVLKDTTDGLRLFFAPWLEPDTGDPVVRDAWRRLAEAVESSRGTSSRVAPGSGEVLVIDNGRMLHGRPALAPGSPRCLQRAWLRMHAPNSVTGNLKRTHPAAEI